MVAITKYKIKRKITLNESLKTGWTIGVAQLTPHLSSHSSDSAGQARLA